MEDDYEDGRDQDYEDSQGSDDDYMPSSREDGNEGPSSRSLRTSQARSRNTASGPQNRDGEEGTSDGGADTTPADNTPAAPRQAAANISQVRVLTVNLSSKTTHSNSRIFSFVCTDFERRCKVVTRMIRTKSRPAECARRARPPTVESSQSVRRNQRRPSDKAESSSVSSATLASPGRKA